MAIFNPTNPVTVGASTQKAHYDRLFDNTNALHADYFPRQTFRGMRLRTHSDNTLFAAQVQLLRAEGVVFDDGYEESVLTPLVANIASAGAGGLDTGAEAASTWYEIYLVQDPISGTKALMLHKADDNFLDEENITVVAAHNLRDTTSNQKVSQGFQVDTAGDVVFVDVQLRKVGTPTGNVWMEIQGDTGSNTPNETVLATSVRMDVAGLSTVAGRFRFVFFIPYSVLVTPTQYHLVLNSDVATSAVNYLQLMGSTTNTYVTRGAKSTYNGTTWTAVPTSDLDFHLYIRRVTAIVMPSGYTRRCLLGYVYNGSGSNFRQFIQFDKTVRHSDQLGTMASGTFSGTWGGAAPVSMLDLALILPPTPVIGQFQQAVGTSGDACGIVPVTEFNSIAGLWRMYISLGASASNGPISADVPVEAQAVYGIVLGAGTAQFWSVVWRYL